MNVFHKSKYRKNCCKIGYVSAEHQNVPITLTENTKIKVLPRVVVLQNTVGSDDVSLHNDRVTSCEEGECQAVPGQHPCLVACYASDLEKVDATRLAAFRVIQMAFQCHLGRYNQSVKQHMHHTSYKKLLMKIKMVKQWSSRLHPTH